MDLVPNKKRYFVESGLVEVLRSHLLFPMFLKYFESVNSHLISFRLLDFLNEFMILNNVVAPLGLGEIGTLLLILHHLHGTLEDDEVLVPSGTLMEQDCICFERYIPHR